MRCLHRDITIKEFADTTLEWGFENGVAIVSDQNPGDIQDEVEVRCHDCGLYKTYRRRTAPKWLKEYLDYISLGGASEDIEAYEKELDRRNRARFA